MARPRPGWTLVRLETASGDYVIGAWLPAFLTPPKVLTWGERTFEHAPLAGAYRECFRVVVLETCDEENAAAGEEATPLHAERQAALQQDPDALPEARLQEIQSVHHRSGPDEDPDHDTRAHCHRGELLEEVQRLKKRLCQALQQHLDDLQRAHDSQAQVFGELRGVVTNLEAQLASERARNERLMDRLEQLQERFMVLGAASLATLESAPGPDGQPGATDPTSSAEDK